MQVIRPARRTVSGYDLLQYVETSSNQLQGKLVNNKKALRSDKCNSKITRYFNAITKQYPSEGKTQTS